MTGVRLLISSCPDRDSATRIAEALVGEGLAACVNIVPGLTSIYRWQGALERAEEVGLLIKTTIAREAEVCVRLKALHPYELPELIAVDVCSGLPAYLAWVAESVRQQTDEPAVSSVIPPS